MSVKTFEFNPISENTYVLYDDTKECVVIDAGCFYPDEKADLFNFIVDNDLIVKHLLNTHMHFDHVFGVNFVADKFQLQMEGNKGDEFLLEQLPAQLKLFGFKENNEPAPKIGKYLNEGDIVTFGKQKLHILYVPGHSPGSIVFYNEMEGYLIAGDVLFRGSIGRTDLAGGNYEQLIEGIRSKLLTLSSETVVYPGHGPKTTIGEEKKNNPFLA